MTRKDYVLIAEVFKGSASTLLFDTAIETQAAYRQWRFIVKDMGDVLEANNPKFDRNKFLQACGIEV